MNMAKALEIAVLIPCFNEAVSIGNVIEGFRRALPGATLYVYDNNSIDETSAIALERGAVVKRVTKRGKGNVVRRMFADVEADVYLLVDGDDTYEPAAARTMVDRLLSQDLDMVCGVRRHTTDEAYRSGHQWGNRVLSGIVARIFGKASQDMLSGYRVMSRRFVKTFPLRFEGFEIETELTVHALRMRCPMAEVETVYRERGEGSTSKLSTIRDGIRISRAILFLFRSELPLLFYGAFALFFALSGMALGLPVVEEYLRTGLVPRFPSAILASGLEIIAALSLVCGLVLSGVTQTRLEIKHLYYLNYLPRSGGGR